jgi:hypothetical protein
MLIKGGKKWTQRIGEAIPTRKRKAKLLASVCVSEHIVQALFFQWQ